MLTTSLTYMHYHRVCVLGNGTYGGGSNDVLRSSSSTPLASIRQEGRREHLVFITHPDSSEGQESVCVRTWSRALIYLRSEANCPIELKHNNQSLVWWTVKEGLVSVARLITSDINYSILRARISGSPTRCVIVEVHFSSNKSPHSNSGQAAHKCEKIAWNRQTSCLLDDD